MTALLSRVDMVLDVVEEVDEVVVVKEEADRDRDRMMEGKQNNKKSDLNINLYLCLKSC